MQNHVSLEEENLRLKSNLGDTTKCLNDLLMAVHQAHTNRTTMDVINAKSAAREMIKRVNINWGPL